MGIISSAVGQVTWVPPTWAKNLGLKRFVLILAVLGLLLAALWVTWTWWQAQPKEPVVTATVTIPPIATEGRDKLIPQPLEIHFQVTSDPRYPEQTVNSVVKLDLLNEEISEGVTISPTIPGVWQWTSETQLTFSPDKEWPAEQEFSVNYSPSIFAPDLKFDETQVEFVTPDFTAAIEHLEFYQDPQQKEIRKVVATVAFSHPVTNDSLKQSVYYSMRRSGQTVKDAPTKLEQTVTYDAYQRRAYIHSEVLKIPEHETYVSLHIDASMRPTEGQAQLDQAFQQSVQIPDIRSYFRVKQVQSLLIRDNNDDPTQSIAIELTDHVATDHLNQNLELYLLPKNLTLRGEKLTNHYWQSASEVTDEALRQSTKLDFQLNPTERSSAQLHSLKLDAPQGAQVFLKINRGLTSDSDFVMNLPYAELVRIHNYPKEVKIAQDGALLPLTGSHKVHFVSRGVRTLRVEIGRLLDSQINHLASQTRGDFTRPNFANYQFNRDNITEKTIRFIDLPTSHPKEASFSHTDLSDLLDQGGYYFINVQGWDRNGEYTVGTEDQRFVLITDLGLLVKANSDNSQEVFVHSIATGNPIAYADVELIGKNGLTILRSITDNLGRASLTRADGFKREQEATAFIVRHRDDSIFMPYRNNSRRLQYSRFDIGGDYSSSNQTSSRLRAQIFTERDLFRPGDTAHIGIIVKRDDWLPMADAPLILSVRDSRGQIALEEKIRLTSDGFLEQDFVTEVDSPTGNYSIALHIIEKNQRRRLIGQHRFKVEEFQPDRLKIQTQILGHKKQGWLKPKDLVCQVDLKNLFGTPAENRKVAGSLQLRPSNILFDQYAGYSFRDPLRDENSAIRPIVKTLEETTTDENGMANLSLDIDQYDQGIYELNVYTEGFEAGGGRSVKSQARVMLSPLDTLIGVKTNGSLQFLKKDSKPSLQLIAVNSDAEKIATTGLKLEIVERRFVSTLIKQVNGTYAYQSIEKEYPISQSNLTIGVDGQSIELPTASAGKFSALVLDAKGIVYGKIPFTVVGARNLTANLEKNAELEISLDRSSYSAGGVIEMQITAPYAGTGLITIERDRVLTHKWFNSDSNSTIQRITIPEKLEGNAYVNIAFIRQLDSPEIFVSPLSYAVTPFSINRSARTVKIDLVAPELSKPGENLEISVSSSKPTKVIVYAVDEGILQVANYAAPEPLEFFLRKMALQVSTFQLVDLILPEFTRPDKSAAPGGGGGGSLVGQNLNPFRRKTEAPVVYWSGIVETGPTAKTLSYAVPDYFNGQLKIIAVAASDDAVGQYQTNTLIRGPFVISPNVITAAAPGDEFEINVGISNNLEGYQASNQIMLKALPTEHLEVVGEDTKQLEIDSGREGQAKFTLRAKQKLGAAHIDFEVQGGQKQAKLRSSLSIRPATTYVNTLLTGSSREDPIELSFDRDIYAHYAKQQVGASQSPLILADGLLEYLDAFPHACAEQIVSKVLPQIAFFGQPDTTVDDSAIAQHYQQTIAKLRTRQASSGGFRFWLGSEKEAEFPSVYISHFLTDANEKNLNAPRDLHNKALQYLHTLAAQQSTSLPAARLRAYAIYVLTRNDVVTTNYLTNLHEYLDREHSSVWRKDLAAAYMAASYQMLKLEDLSKQLIGEYKLTADNQMTSDFDTRLGRDAQYVYILAKHFPGQLALITTQDIDHLIQPIMQNRFNTLSSSYVVLALSAYTQAVFDRTGATPLAIRASNASKQTLGRAAVFARSAVDHAIKNIQISGGNNEEVYYVLAQSGFDQNVQQQELANGLEISKHYLDDKGQEITRANIGQELSVRIRIRSKGVMRSNVALVDLLPGGFEVISDSVRNQYHGGRADYIDVREDRVVIYGSFSDRISEITYKVKAISAGKFVVPAAHASSMYDRTIQAHTASGLFIIESAQ